MKILRSILTIFLAALITMPFAYALLATRTTHPVDGVTTIRLVGRCELDYLDNLVELNQF